MFKVEFRVKFKLHYHKVYNMLIIMMHGNPLSGKSTVARSLKLFFGRTGLKADIIKSAKTRFETSIPQFTKRLVDEKNCTTRMEKDKSYLKMLEIADEKIDKGIIPILDATFHRKRRRLWVYEFATTRNIPLLIVKLHAWNINAKLNVRQLLANRRKKHSHDNFVNTYGIYKTMCEQMQPITTAEISSKNISIITVDRKTNNVEFTGKLTKSMLIKQVIHWLQKAT